MDTMMAPALASIVVAHYEENYLDSLYQKPLVWKHYVDDVLTIWPYSKQDFINFFNGLNLVHPNLKACPHLIWIRSTSISHLSPLRTKLDQYWINPL